MSRWGGGAAIVVFCSWLILGPECRADQVTLKNGTQISGKIVKKDGDDLSLKAPPLGDVTIPWADVTAIISDDPATVVFLDGKSVVGRLTSRDGQIQVDTLTMPLDQVGQIFGAAEKARLDRVTSAPWTELWGGYIDFGASLAQGNAESVTVTTIFRASRATLNDKTSAYFNQIYGRATVEDVTATNAQALRGGWSYNRNLSKRVFLNVFNDYEYDRFQDLDLRFVVGGGLGYKFIDTERTQLDLVGGFAYNREKFSTDVVRHSAEAFWGDDWTYKLTSVSSLEQSFRMFHNLSRTGEYRLNFDLALATTLRKWLAWQVSVSDRYLSDPLPGRVSNDLIFTTGLRIRFEH
jgi:putative salt-induced outer membrane protein YdiY